MNILNLTDDNHVLAAIRNVMFFPQITHVVVIFGTHLSVLICLILLDTYIYPWHHVIQIKISVEIILQYYFTFRLFYLKWSFYCLLLILKVPSFMFLLSFSILCLNLKHYFHFNYVDLLNIYVYLSAVGSIFWDLHTLITNI